MTEFTEEERESAVQEMNDALAACVHNIEAGTKLTQNHYGAYMSLLGAFKNQDVASQRRMAQALIRVGGNSRGVEAGFKAATGEVL